MEAKNVSSILNECSGDSLIDATYHALNVRYDNIYKFVMNYSDYIYSSHSYGGAEPLTMIEVHTLTHIEDHPGVTPKELIVFWNRTKGSISQILNRLTQRGLITKEKMNGNAKTIHLYVTEEGRRISKAHKMFDIQDITKTVSELQEHCSVEELETFYKVIAIYNEVIRQELDARKAERCSEISE